MYQPKISLKNIMYASFQDIFDQVATHLLTQKEKAITGVQCKYKLKKDGKCLRCAAGSLIADDEYQLQFEGFNWFGLIRRYFEDNNSVGYDETAFINDLQNVHDNSAVLYWKSELINFAKEYKLSPKVLDQF